MFDHLVLPLALIATAVVFVGYVIVEVHRAIRGTDPDVLNTVMRGRDCECEDRDCLACILDGGGR